MIVCPGCGTPVPSVWLVGVEQRGVYDGVLIWKDTRCGHMWPRFSPPGRLHDAAVALLADGATS